MMSDAIDAGMDTADDLDAADKIYAQICDEIGVELAEENEVSGGKINTGAAKAVSHHLNLTNVQKIEDSDDLQARLDMLKR